MTLEIYDLIGSILKRYLNTVSGFMYCKYHVNLINIWQSEIFIWFSMDNDDFCQEFKAILRPCIFNNYEFFNIPKIAKKSKISAIFKLCKHRNQRPNLYDTSRFLGKHCIWFAKAKNQETGLYIELRRTTYKILKHFLVWNRWLCVPEKKIRM